MCRDGISLLTFFGRASLVSLYMCGKPEASGGSARLHKLVYFIGRLGMCLSLLSVQCLRGGGLPRTVFLTLTVPWSSGIPAYLATRAGDQRAGLPCMVYTYTLAGFRKTVENILTCGVQRCSGRVLPLCVCTSFMLGAGKCCDGPPLPPMT